MTVRTIFESEVMPHLDAGYNLARWLARDPHDASDVVQEACARALRYIGSLRPGEGRSWFLTVVRHSYYDWRRKNHPAEIDPEAGDRIDEIEDAAQPDPETLALRKGQFDLLARAVESLPDNLREALVLREFEDLSYKEIAQVLEIPVGTVMSRLSRARTALLEAAKLLESGASARRVP